MNQDHAIAGVGGVSATALLTTVLQHFQGVDPATASAEAGLVVLALGTIFGIIQNGFAPRAAAPLAPPPPPPPPPVPAVEAPHV